MAGRQGKAGYLWVLVLLVAGVVAALQGPHSLQAAPIDETKVEVVASGLEVPWALAFAPDGRLFVTERPGRIRIVQDGVLQEEPLASLDVARVGESGLMGIALDPAFETNGYVYVCYSYFGEGSQIRNRIARLTDEDGRGGDHTVLVDGIPGAGIHDGCRLKFGPDGKLYATTGDAAQGQPAQDLGSLAGKVLRMNPDGSVPEDNPFPGSLVYTYGHRNPQGLDFHPETGQPYISEHGPSDNDEVNILVPGGNYGWPIRRGVVNEPGFVDPILTFTPTIAPAGATFYTGDQLPAEWQGSFFFTTLKAVHIHRVVLEADGIRHEELFGNEFGRLRDIVQGPDGYLYFTTSNRDGRGFPREGDDHILRIVPRVQPEPSPTPSPTPVPTTSPTPVTTPSIPPTPTATPTMTSTPGPTPSPEPTPTPAGDPDAPAGVSATTLAIYVGLGALAVLMVAAVAWWSWRRRSAG